MTMTVIALIGSRALYLMYLWLLSAIVASYLSERKGYGERIGLAFGVLLTFVGALIWLVWPAKKNSKWKQLGPVGRGKADKTKIDAAADRAADQREA
jgi:hypothetical protein